MKRNTPFPILVEQREKNESKLGKLGKMKPGSNYMLEKKILFFSFDLVVSRNGLAQVMAHREAKLVIFLLILNLLFQ